MKQPCGTGTGDVFAELGVDAEQIQSFRLSPAFSLLTYLHPTEREPSELSLSST